MKASADIPKLFFCFKGEPKRRSFMDPVDVAGTENPLTLFYDRFMA